VGKGDAVTGGLYPGRRIHPTALIERDVSIGEGTSVWDNVHIRHGASIGRHCIIGEKTYIAYDVKIGNFCKLNANVYVCAGVTVSEYTMLSAHVVFTNDRFPRAFDKTLDGLASSEPNEETLSTHVGIGVTVGANATIGPGLRLGDFAMVGMGSVVTRDIPPLGLVIGSPAKLAGFVCACGPVLIRIKQWEGLGIGSEIACHRCGRAYARIATGVAESAPVGSRPVGHEVAGR
jgi:UDP-2-acetamido-3-amino-2,3-dideoxy-glucuronate N-acetyltransferase